MEVTNAVSPTQAQLEGFLDPAAKGPIYMLNLLNFKEQAEYEDGRTNLPAERLIESMPPACQKSLHRSGAISFLVPILSG